MCAAVTNSPRPLQRAQHLLVMNAGESHTRVTNGLSGLPEDAR
jgi:hypothetical protein